MVAWLAKWKFCIIALSICAAIFGIFGTLRLGFDTDTRVYFGPDTEERQALDTLEARHGRFDAAVFVIRPKKGTVYEPESLKAINEIVDRLLALPQVLRFSAITEFPVDSERAGKTPTTLYERFISELYFKDLRDYAIRNTRQSASIVSNDGTVAAVVATIDKDHVDRKSQTDIIKKLREIRDNVRKKFPSVDVLLTGNAELDATFIDALKSDLLWLVPAQVLVLIALLLITLGSLTATFALLLLLGVATIGTVGIAGWLGMTLNGVTSAVPTVLLGLAVATCVHIILAWQDALRRVPDKLSALAYAIAVNKKPVSLAIATTVASFLCLNFSNSPPFQQFGNLVALGLVLTYILSFTLLPALLLVIPPSRALSRQSLESRMAHLGGAVLKHGYIFIVTFVLITALAIYGINRIKFDDTFAHYFDHRFEFRLATDLYEKKLSGITVIDFSLPAPDQDKIDDRLSLKRIKEFTTWLEQQPKVATVLSIETIVSDIGKNIPGALDREKLPANDVIAKSLIDNYLDSDKQNFPVALLDDTRRFARVSVSLSQISSAQLLEFAKDANNKVDALWGAGTASATGVPILAAHLSSRNTKAMFTGTLVALAAISAILVLTLGGVRRGLVSLVPNLVPLILAYGFWGHVLQEVSFAATVVVAMTFGIVVDDTVHIMSRYQYLRNNFKIDPPDAVIESFRTVGVAVLITSLAIASGFAVLTFSGFLVNQHLGQLTVITLAAALITDLLFLPPLLVLADRSTRKRKRRRRPAREGPM